MKDLFLGKRVLIIGGGQDIDNRRIGEKIDSGEIADVVVRVNKSYGMPEDSGTRTDAIFTRWRAWLAPGVGWFDQAQIDSAKVRVFVNEEDAVRKAAELARREVGVSNISCGCLAVWFALNCGAESVSVIGFGWNGVNFVDKKIYGRNARTYQPGTVDYAAYDWKKEQDWLSSQQLVILL